MQFNVSFDSSCLTDGFPKCSKCFSTLFQPHSCVPSALFIRPAVSWLPLSTSPHLSCYLLALPVRGSADDTIAVCAVRTKDNIGAKARPAGFLIWMLLQREEALDTGNGCSKLHLQQRWQSLFLFHLSLNTHSRLLGKQGWQALQCRRNACPVWAYTLSRAPNCSDKYEMAEIRDKDS